VTETELPPDIDATVDAVVCGVPEILAHLADGEGDRERRPVSVRVSDNTIDVRLRLSPTSDGAPLSDVVAAVRAALTTIWPDAAIDVTLECPTATPRRPRPTTISLADADAGAADPPSHEHGKAHP
jgi:hypothetical protein